MTESNNPERMPPSGTTFAAGISGAKPDETLLKDVLSEATVKGAEVGAPQETVESFSGAIGAAAWYNDKKVTALWSINQNRNSWVAISDVGWKKLEDNSDSSVVAMTMLASHALAGGRTSSLREDDSGKIAEIYVW
jgi:hypothetical protein